MQITEMGGYTNFVNEVGGYTIVHPTPVSPDEFE